LTQELAVKHAHSFFEKHSLSFCNSKFELMDSVKGQDDFSADLLFTMDAPCKRVFLEVQAGRRI
jgi:hypothetical protein